MYALFSYAYFWSIENNCVAANGAVRFSVRGFGCALFILGGKTMNKKEKVIIQSNPIKASVAVKIILIIGVAAALIVLSAFLAGGWEGTSWLFALGTFAVFGLIALVVYLAFNGMQLILTDKRIYGRGFFGKQMSLPCDKISSINTTILFGGIVIGTSSGYLRWYCFGFKNKIYILINEIIIDRQEIITDWQENNQSAENNEVPNTSESSNIHNQKKHEATYATKIQNNEFRDRNDITTFSISSNATSIGQFAFSGCINLENIKIPSNVKTIGYMAFNNCSSLTSIVIPNSVVSLGGFAFAGCPNLTIYCEAESQPLSWHERWNPNNRPVVWGYKGE